MSAIAIINNAVQSIAKFLAFAAGMVLAVLAYILIHLVRLVQTILFVAPSQLIYYVNLLFSIVCGSVYFSVAWASNRCMMFAMDISPRDYKKRMEMLMEEIEQRAKAIEAQRKATREAEDDDIS